MHNHFACFCGRRHIKDIVRESYTDTTSASVGPNTFVRHLQIFKSLSEQLESGAMHVYPEHIFLFSRGLQDYDTKSWVALAPLYIKTNNPIDSNGATLFVVPQFKNATESDDKYAYFHLLIHDILLRHTSLQSKISAINVRVEADFNDGIAYLKEQGFNECTSVETCAEFTKICDA